MNALRLLRVSLIALLLAGASQAQATLINFGSLGDGNAAALLFPVEGLTVTGSDLVQFSSSVITSTNGGLGIVGGPSAGIGDTSLDLGETMTFLFDHAVSSLLLTLHDISPPGNVSYGINAFLGATDLGFFAITPHATESETKDLFSLVGTAFDSFTISLQASAPLGLVIESIEFELDPSIPVPLPATPLLFIAALLGMRVVRRR